MSNNVSDEIAEEYVDCCNDTNELEQKPSADALFASEPETESCKQDATLLAADGDGLKVNGTDRKQDSRLSLLRQFDPLFRNSPGPLSTVSVNNNDSPTIDLEFSEKKSDETFCVEDLPENHPCENTSCPILQISATEMTDQKQHEEVNMDLQRQLKNALDEKEAIAKENEVLRAKMMTFLDEAEQMNNICTEYSSQFASQNEDLRNVKTEYECANRHLSTLESAFNDLLQKYERCKNIIEGFKTNEQTLRKNLTLYEEILRKNEEKYEALKAHAKGQLENASKEIMQQRESLETEISRLTTLVKRLEIKNESVRLALDQKTKECTSMAALLDEMTGNKL